MEGLHPAILQQSEWECRKTHWQRIWWQQDRPKQLQDQFCTPSSPYSHQKTRVDDKDRPTGIEFPSELVWRDFFHLRVPRKLLVWNYFKLNFTFSLVFTWFLFPKIGITEIRVIISDIRPIILLDFSVSILLNRLKINLRVNIASRTKPSFMF